MSTWRETADAVLARLAVPADADMKARRRAVNAARPHEFAVTSWGRKVWSQAARSYLEQHGLPPRVIAVSQMESPLERARRRAGAA